MAFSTDRGDLARADLVIEAVPERLEVKAALFADLDQICPPETVLATNTSPLPVTQIAASTQRPALGAPYPRRQRLISLAARAASLSASRAMITLRLS